MRPPPNRVAVRMYARTRLPNTMHLDLAIPADALRALNPSPEAAGAEIRMAAAAKLYELGRLSSGAAAAAALAGLPRAAFLARLADYGVAALDLSDDDLDRETRLA